MIVVDTNLVIPILVDHEQTANATTLFSLDPDWHLPDWWLIELANVLRNYQRANLFSQEEVETLLARALRLFPAQNTHSVDLRETLLLACKHDVSAYDARFITLARQFRQKLITEDKRLRKACPDDTLSLAQAISALT
jgi:predicted nucleic acid-binding protein